MAVKIGNARKDENGNIHGGAAGDQTGREVCTQDWYSYPWNCVLRASDSATAEKIAQAMEYACANNNIGYDQYQRTTLYAAVASMGWYPGNIAKVKTKVETDCSALVAVCVNCALGKAAVSKDIYTGNEASSLLSTGKFSKLVDSRYLTGTSYLRRGDILINTKSHTAVVVDTGSKATPDTTVPTPVSGQTGNISPAKSFDKQFAKTYTVSASGGLNMRKGPGTSYGIIKTLPTGTKATCYGYYSRIGTDNWMLVVAVVDNVKYTGYCISKYLK